MSLCIACAVVCHLLTWEITKRGRRYYNRVISHFYVVGRRSCAAIEVLQSVCVFRRRYCIMAFGPYSLTCGVCVASGRCSILAIGRFLTCDRSLSRHYGIRTIYCLRSPLCCVPSYPVSFHFVCVAFIFIVYLLSTVYQV